MGSLKQKFDECAAGRLESQQIVVLPMAGNKCVVRIRGNFTGSKHEFHYHSLEVDRTDEAMEKGVEYIVNQVLQDHPLG